MENELSGYTNVVMTWLTTEGLVLLKNLIVFGLILLIGKFASGIVGKTVKVALSKSRLNPSPLLNQFVVNVSKKAVFLLAFIIALGNLGVDTAALIAGLGASGLVIGFALKDTLSNFAAGGLILLYRPFDVNDFVEIGGTSGTVKDLTLVSTILRTPDNKVITLPNSKVWGNSITNYSASETRRVDLVAGIAYDADVDEASELLLNILKSHPLVLEDPAPAVRMKALSDSSVDLNVRGWAKTGDYWTVYADVLREMKYQLDAAGIGIPFPQRDVWVHHVPTDDGTK